MAAGIEVLVKLLTDLYIRESFENVRFSIVDFYDERDSVDDNLKLRVIKGSFAVI